MFSSMTCDLLEHGRIKTTTPKAKELRRYVEKMITLAKSGDLASRRRAMAFMRSKLVVTKLFDVIAGDYKSRNGGYTRMIKCGLRAGDCAPMSIIELVQDEAAVVETTEASTKATSTKATSTKTASTKAAPKKAATAKAEDTKVASMKGAPTKAAPKKVAKPKAKAEDKEAAAPKKVAPKKAAPKKEDK
jgi:large subunit ribosomal protein L17